LTLVFPVNRSDFYASGMSIPILTGTPPRDISYLVIVFKKTVVVRCCSEIEDELEGSADTKEMRIIVHL
jgi:hypothetical protein